MDIFKVFPEGDTWKFHIKSMEQPLRFKFGIDPTAERMHLGHLVPLLVLKDYMHYKHKIDIVLGTFTAQLGDPSGKDTMRPILDRETTLTNAQKLLDVVLRILNSRDESQVVVHFNHTWFEKMSAVEMINILSKFNVGHLLARDSFQLRMKAENPIGMHELVVPILQGYDSVHLKTDVEVGGSDQLFNFAITRDMQKIFDQDPEVCLLMPIINGTDGRKMSKSYGNCIFLDESPIDVYGKTMSISDILMQEWFSVFMEREIDMKKPMVEKKALAFAITSHVWSEKDAMLAQEHFESVIQNRNKPKEFVEVGVDEIVNVIATVRKCSLSESRRLLKYGGVKVNDEVASETVSLKPGDILKIGKLNYAKVV